MPCVDDRSFDYHLPAAFPLERLEHRQHDRTIRSLHWHNVLELGLCRAGVGVFVIGDRIEPFAPGCVVGIGPGRPHLARSRSGSISRWSFLFVDAAAMFGNGWRERGADDAADLACLVQSETETDLITAALDELEGRADAWQSVTRGLLHALVLRLLRHPSATGERQAADLAPAIDLVSQRFDHPLRVLDLAGACRMSVATLRRRFHEQFGLSPQQYLTRFRVQVAGQYLHEGLSVGQTAAAVGYADRTALHRAFRGTVGQSPAAWRRRRDAGTISASAPRPSRAATRAAHDQ